jgi:site-specific recombinase XerD
MRDYLFPTEIKRLMDAAKQSPRHGVRNNLMILLAYRHGLRISELVDLRLSDIDLQSGRINCRRLKGSTHNIHPLEGDELRLIKRWLRIRSNPSSEFLFVSERGTPITRQAAWRIFKEAGKKAGLEINVRPHMLKHSCGYYLADKGCDTRLIQEYLGHKNIQNTVRYTQTNAKRFEGLWR